MRSSRPNSLINRDYWSDWHRRAADVARDARRGRLVLCRSVAVAPVLPWKVTLKMIRTMAHPPTTPRDRAT